VARKKKGLLLQQDKKTIRLDQQKRSAAQRHMKIIGLDPQKDSLLQ